MVEVKFYDSIDDELLKFAVIISKTNGKWIFCKHRERVCFSLQMYFLFKKYIVR